MIPPKMALHPFWRPLLILWIGPCHVMSHWGLQLFPEHKRRSALKSIRLRVFKVGANLCESCYGNATLHNGMNLIWICIYPDLLPFFIKQFFLFAMVKTNTWVFGKVQVWATVIVPIWKRYVTWTFDLLCAESCLCWLNQKRCFFPRWSLFIVTMQNT